MYICICMYMYICMSKSIRSLRRRRTARLRYAQSPYQEYIYIYIYNVEWDIALYESSTGTRAFESLPRFVGSRFPGNSLWTGGFHP